MSDLMYVALLVIGAILLAIFAVVYGVFNWLWDKRNRYAASCFTEISDSVDTRDRLKQEKETLEETIRNIKDEIGRLGEKKEQSDRLNAELTDKERKLLQLQDAVENAYKARAELAEAQSQMEQARKLHGELEAEVNRLQQDKAKKSEEARSIENELTSNRTEREKIIYELGQLQVQKITLQSEKKALEDSLKSARQAEEQACRDKQVAIDDVEKTKSAIAELKKEVETLQERKIKLEDTKPELIDCENRLRNLQYEIKNCEKQLDKTKEERESLQKEIDTQEELVRRVRSEGEKLASLKEQTNRLTERKSELEIELNKTQAEVLHLRGTLQEASEDNTSESDLMRDPGVLKTAPKKRSSVEKINENNLLQDFCSRLSEIGLIFSKRTIHSFHTALKCQGINPLTVLAGVSGTGKTLLPIQYARFMGMMHHVISVQPRWDSPQDLFGFYNYLERQYKATELSRLLWTYKENSSVGNGYRIQDLMTVVLFDEMNLARTEYYFSDFLSKLELRRTSSRDAEIQIDIARKTISLPIPLNMLMVGTMNEDESTQTLSDKVLDRANVLRFGKPEKVTGEDCRVHDVGEARQVVTKSVWDNWVNSAELKPDAERKVSEWIATLNDALEQIGRPFGYRVQEAILKYVALYPSYDAQSYKLAFADQIEQKILPKLRGVDPSNPKYDGCLAQLKSLVEKTDDKELWNALEDAEKDAQDQGFFVWNGVSRKEENS